MQEHSGGLNFNPNTLYLGSQAVQFSGATSRRSGAASRGGAPDWIGRDAGQLNPALACLRTSGPPASSQVGGETGAREQARPVFPTDYVSPENRTFINMAPNRSPCVLHITRLVRRPTNKSS